MVSSQSVAIGEHCSVDRGGYHGVCNYGARYLFAILLKIFPITVRHCLSVILLRE
jgi:hypothetical protein